VCVCGLSSFFLQGAMTTLQENLPDRPRGITVEEEAGLQMRREKSTGACVCVCV